ncbi:MAG: AAA family ATPase [Candidatus Binatota bacterium]
MTNANGGKETMNKRPFSLTADLDFLYISDHHKRVFEETLSAIKRRDGLICIIGEPGTGKTVLCRRILEELDGNYNVVLVNTPPKTPRDMTETLDAAFGDMEGDSRIPLAVFDEAQHLDFRCLDHVKFLTNLEKNAERLLQVILVGQPELAEKISHKRFNQLEQRIGAKLKVGALKKKEVLPYLTHRLTIAGLSEEIRFTKPSARYLYRKTSGVPRLINRMANLAVEQASQRGLGRIGVGQVKIAFSKVSATRDNWIAPKKPLPLFVRLSALFFLLTLSMVLFLYYNPQWQPSILGESLGKSRSLPSPPQFIVKAGTFLVKDQAEELRDQLDKQGFPSDIVKKEFGDGWILYQVRLEGRYSKEEADNVMEILRTIGIKSVDVIEIKP